MMLLDRLLNSSLTEIRTAILKVGGIDHPRHPLNRFDHCLHVDHGRDIRSSMADESTNSWHQASTLSSIFSTLTAPTFNSGIFATGSKAEVVNTLAGGSI